MGLSSGHTSAPSPGRVPPARSACELRQKHCLGAGPGWSGVGAAPCRGPCHGRRGEVPLRRQDFEDPALHRTEPEFWLQDGVSAESEEAPGPREPLTQGQGAGSIGGGSSWARGLAGCECCVSQHSIPASRPYRGNSPTLRLSSSQAWAHRPSARALPWGPRTLPVKGTSRVGEVLPAQSSGFPLAHPTCGELSSACVSPEPWGSLSQGHSSSSKVRPACLFFFFLAAPRGMQDLSPPPGIEPVPPAVGARSLNHWTAREVPVCPFLKSLF